MEITYLINLCAVSGFWLGFFVAGESVRQAFERKFGRFENDFFERLFWNFFGTAAALTPVALISYALQLDLWFLAISYLALLFSGIFLLSKRFLPQIKDFFFNRLAINLRVDYLVLIFVAALSADYLISSYMGAYIPWDAFVHTAKINKIIHDGFSINDPFFRNLVDPRYHVNVVHALYAIPGKFDLKAVDIWQNSLPFFRMMIWLSVYSLAQKFFEKKEFSMFSSVLAIIFFSSAQLYANYPNNIVYIWISAFIIGFLLYSKKQNLQSFLVLLAAATLVTFTHPTFAIGLMILVPLLGVALYLAKVIDRRALIQVALLEPVLAIGPLISYLMPNNMSAKVAAYGNFKLTQLGHGLFIFTPPTIMTLTFFAVTAALLFIILDKKTDLRVKVIVSLVTLFPVFILYNPLLLPLLNKLFPLWMIVAFRQINVFSKFLLFFPVFYLVWLYLRGEKAQKYRILVLFVFVLFFTYLHHERPLTLAKKMPEFRYSYGVSKEIMSFDPFVDEDKVILSDYWTSFNIPSVLDNYVTTMYEDNASPAADMKKNFEIEKAAFSNNSESFLWAVKESGASYLIIKKEDLGKITNIGNLNRLHSSKDYVLYSVGEQN